MEKFKNHVISANGALRKLVALQKNQVPYRRVLIMMEHSVEAGVLYGLPRAEEL